MFIRDIVKTLVVANLTLWYILQNKASIGELNNIKRPEKPRKMTKVNDRRVLQKCLYNIDKSLEQCEEDIVSKYEETTS